ncbi:aldehyde dehydrogenase family protein [Asanoa sp. NPDC049518]|uniref:aldehyde dehydrogenase family protein n=1 Tax=unclassified Asanoa TaxID=2685164 RepID=UPI0034398912
MLAAHAVIAVHNPGTGERLGEVPVTTQDGLDAAIEAAQHGQRAMASMPAHERAALLHRIAAGIEEELESLAHLLAQENGKPISQTRGEVAAAIRIFRGLAGEATRIFGRQIPLDAVPGLERHFAVTIREPLGVVAALVRSTTPSSCTPTRPAPPSPPATR